MLTAFLMLTAAVCCLLLKHSCSGKPQGKSEENPSCTFNLKAPYKQAMVPSDSIHTATETGSLQRPFLIPPNLYDSMKTMLQTSPPTATGFKPSVICRVLHSPTKSYLWVLQKLFLDHIWMLDKNPAEQNIKITGE